jgi:hypothetical protein
MTQTAEREALLALAAKGRELAKDIEQANRPAEILMLSREIEAISLKMREHARVLRGQPATNEAPVRAAQRQRQRRRPWPASAPARTGRARQTPAVMPAALDISVIAPVYNEQGNLAPLHQRLVDSLVGLGRSFEILYVDDGSSDQSYAELQAIAEADPRARVVRLRRNFGQTAAIAAGIEHASGAYLVIIDAELDLYLQNDLANMLRRGIDEIAIDKDGMVTTLDEFLMRLRKKREASGSGDKPRATLPPLTSH